jgi:hypothetical protein
MAAVRWGTIQESMHMATVRWGIIQESIHMSAVRWGTIQESDAYGGRTLRHHSGINTYGVYVEAPFRNQMHMVAARWGAIQ